MAGQTRVYFIFQHFQNGARWISSSVGCRINGHAAAAASRRNNQSSLYPGRETVTERRVSTTRLLLERQGFHLLLFVALVGGISVLADLLDVWDGDYRGVPTRAWFWLAIGSAVVHQGWVWLCWRLELHTQWLSRTFGPAGFRLYAAGFALAAVARFVLLVAVANANHHTLPVSEAVLDVSATVLLVPIAHLFYSVARYFTFPRALGLDHFDPSYRTKSLERRGMFRFTRNGMYTFGLLLVWLPGLYAASKAALLAALFHHAYIWVHYACTELPDMRRIYGADAIGADEPTGRA